MKNKIGIFGGSFDPVHWGHIKPVLSALKYFKLKYVIYLPALKPPHKMKTKFEDPFHRMAMLAIALEPYKKFKISTFDLHNPGSKTLYSLKHFKKILNAEIYFILGSDSLLDFQNWYKPDKILKISKLIVLTRPKFELNKIIEKLPFFIKEKINSKIFFFPHPSFSISGTNIRKLLKNNKKFKALLPEKVKSYIIKNNLYKEV